MLANLKTVLVTAHVAFAIPALQSTTTSSAARGQSIEIPIKYNENFRPDGFLALAKARQKYGVPMANGLYNHVMESFRGSNAKDKRQNTGTVTTFPVPDYDREYLAEVDFGTPAQKLYMDFDSGSSDLWVFSTETPSSQVKGQKLYNPGSSSTANRLNGASWNISYNDGSSCSGDVYTDVVKIGGLTVPKQAVESAKQVSAGFINGPSQSSGLVGLGFDHDNRVSPNKQKTWISNIKSSLKAPIFTARFRHQANGTYNFGYIDQNQYSGSLTYTSVEDRGGHWGWTSTGYSIGSGRFQSVKITGIADTGTSLLLLPDDIVDNYYRQVNGHKYDSAQDIHYWPCNVALPDFTFGVEGSTIVIPGQLINYGYYDSNRNLCFGGIQYKHNGDTIWGDIAHKAALVVYDIGNMRLGWAKGK